MSDDQVNNLSNPYSHEGSERMPRRGRSGVVVAAAAGLIAGAGLGEANRNQQIGENQRAAGTARNILEEKTPKDLSPTEYVSDQLYRSMEVNALRKAEENTETLNDPREVAANSVVWGGTGALAAGGLAAAVRRRRDNSQENPPERS